MKWHGLSGLRSSFSFLTGLTFFFCPDVSYAFDTLIIADEANGRDCASIGLWDDGTKTCTLTRTFEGFVEIAGDNITLDGGGFTLGALGGPAVAIRGRSHVTVRNLQTSSASQGILATNGSFITIRDSNFGSQAGVGFHNISDSTVEDNTFTAPAGGGTTAVSIASDLPPNLEVNARNKVLDNSIQGQFLSGMNLSRSYGSEVSRNSFKGIRETAVSFLENDLLTARDNSVTESGFGYFVTPYSSFDTARDSIFEDNTQDNLEFEVLYDATSTPSFGTTTLAGLLCFRCHDMTIEGLTFKGSGLGLSFGNSVNVIAKNNIFEHVSTAIASHSSQNVLLIHNDFRQYNSVLATHNNAGDIRFSDPLPQGGNHYMPFDSVNEGCIDTDGNFICEEDLKIATGYWDEAPWIDTQHWQNIDPSAECCSSIIFIPGIKGSRLVKSEFGLDDELWLPTIFNKDDVRQLALNFDGISITKNIYTPGLLDRIFIPGILEYDTYFSFTNFLTQLVNDGEVAEAKIFQYDWREDVYDIVQNPIPISKTSSYKMLDALRDIANSSKTGRVIIIGHSNGGLVAKALMDTLGEEAGQLIEKFVLIGTPQLGTPKAIASILHATNENIPTIINAADSRFSSRNMLGAFGLLPIGTYGTYANKDVIQFSNISETLNFRTAYGTSINSPTELTQFLTGALDKRIEPSETALSEPIVLNQTLLTKARMTRSKLENWLAPDGVEVIEIVGTGLPTIDSMNYSSTTKSCSSGKDTCVSPEPKFSNEGDGTVMTVSAKRSSTSSYQVDLSSLNSETKQSWEHGSLMAIPQIHKLLVSIIKNEEITLPKHIYANNGSIPGSSMLILKAFSPVTLKAKDRNGNELKFSTTASSTYLINQIPNGIYGRVGEMQYIAFPSDSNVTITIQGTATGTLDLKVEKITGSTTQIIRTNTNIPVTTHMQFALETTLPKADINVDLNGDGQTDQILWTSRTLTPQQLLSEISIYVKGTSINKVTKTAWQLRIEIINAFIKNKKKTLAVDSLNDFISAIEINYKLKVISADIRVRMLRLLEELKELLLKQ